MSLQPKDLRYTITTDYDSEVLDIAPRGWDEGLVKWVRSEKYWGLFRSFSVPMQFALRGRDLLAYAFASQGSEANATVLIERLDRTTWQYKTYYSGKVDFSTAKWTHDYMECNLVEGGISQLIKTNETTKYDVNKTGFNSGIVHRTLVKLPETSVETLETYYDFATYKSIIQALLNQMAGEAVPFQCSILDDLDDDGATLYITNGRALRNRWDNAKNITTTLYDLYQFLNARFCCGMGIEVIEGVDTVVIERRAYFLQNTEICATLPNTREVEITMAKQFISNRIKYGYPSWEGLTYPFSDYNETYINFINTGRFQKTVEGAIPVKTGKNEIDATTVYYAEGTMIQVVADYNADNLTTEEEHDNDLFVAVGYHDTNPLYYPYSFYPGNTSEVEEALNTYLSPKRCLSDWIPYINSITAGITEVLPYPVKITLTLPEGVANVSTDVFSEYPPPGNVTVEPIDVVIDGAGAIFKPYILKIKTSGTVDIADIFEANHNGYISFVYKGVTLKGYIMEVSANPSRRRELEFTLLAHKDTDLTLLLPDLIPAS